MPSTSDTAIATIGLGFAVHGRYPREPVTWQGEPASHVTLWPLERPRELDSQANSDLDIEIADSVIVTDASASFRVQSFNRAAERLFGWKESEVLGLPASEVVPMAGNAELVRSQLISLRENGRWHGQTLQRGRDGTVVAVFSSA